MKVVHARYLTREGLDAVRGFYRGVFRSEGWKVANVEFFEDEWAFLVVRGEREADIEIESHGRDVTEADIEFSEPLPGKTPAPVLPSASPAPQSTPIPDDYEEGGEDQGDLGDGGGND